nr:MAG TPA: hypothetical protein [Caudoviricetes sp.]
MNAIISPWVFYWIDVCNSFKLLVFVVFAIAVIAAGISFLCSIDDLATSDEVRMFSKSTKISVIVAAASIVLYILLPSENVSYKMLAANMFTQDNINSATEYVTDVIDYAVDKVKELQPNTEE